MPTYDYLRKQALTDVWRVPSLDRQFIVNPQRVTKNYGRVKNATVMWDTVKLPDNTSRWHVYDVSSVAAVNLNIFTKYNSWTAVSETTARHGVYTDIYVSSGLQLPRFDTYYRYTESGVLLLAVKINRKLKCNLDQDQLFFRVYSGAYNTQNQDLPTNINVKTFGLYYFNLVDKDTFLNSLNTLPVQGKVHVFHNGVWVDNINNVSLSFGDYIEYIWDKSFVKTKDWAIKDLYHYVSELDRDQKYLIHHDEPGDNVDFYDDIDVYVYQKAAGQPFRGIYFHKNSLAAVRQLTHRDYGLRTKNIPPIAKLLESIGSPELSAPIDSLYIRFDYRESGLTKNKLVYENYRIFELYKLKDQDIVRAMQGIDSSVKFWSAPELEKSYYSFAMRCSYNELTKEVAEKVYGYNASAKIVGNSPIKVDPNNVQDIPLPIRAQHGCTVYEYDSNGFLTNWYIHYGGQSYRAKDPDTTYLEIIIGLGSERLDQILNARSLQLKENLTYRVYNTSIIGSSLQGKVEDVTFSDKYSIVNNQFTWLSTRAADFPIVMSDGVFFAKDYKVRANFGVMNITLSTLQDRPLGDGLYPMLFPMGQLNVFLNKRLLIRGIDYFFNFPNINIVNQEYLNDPLVLEQDVHVRFCGFAKYEDNEFKITQDADVGFIEHGFLSNNNRFDLRDDKVQRIVVGGRLFTKEEIQFSEEHSGASIINAANGLPYMVEDVLVPVKPYTVKDMYLLKQESRVIDKAVSDYLTLKLPQPVRGPIMAIPNRHRVYSPFFHKLVTDLKNNTLKLNFKAEGFTKQEVIDKCKTYEYLLASDPLNDNNAQDERFVVILPHGFNKPIGLTANSYRFLSMAVQLYGKNLVQLSPFIKTI